MIPAEFEYVAAGSVKEAIDLLQQHGDGAKLLAGGHSLIPMMKLRLAQPAVLVDISKIDGLSGVSRSDGTISIGALTTHAAIETDSTLAEALPLMREAATHIGDPMVRNRGTFGGSLAHADPAGDWPAVALAVGGTAKLTGPNGDRSADLDEFFIDILTSDLQEGEVLTAVELNVPSGKYGTAYKKFSHPASGYAVIGAAAVVTLNDDGTCASARVAVTGAGPKATRLTSMEEALVGKQLDEASVSAAASSAGEGMDFLGDIFASEEYRAHLVKVYAKRAVLAAAEAAK